jgi:hypothetical protein
MRKKKRKYEEDNFEKKNMWGMEEKKQAGNGKKKYKNKKTKQVKKATVLSSCI